MDRQDKWFKESPDDQVWWLDNQEVKGEFIFSFDRKTSFNLFRNYPWKLSPEQKKIFDEENPFWADYFKDRSR